MRRVMVTIDIEAQPARASSDHIERLVYGRFDEKESFGIERMFDIADKYGASLTCFLDYAEQDVYGDALLDVGRCILSRGHDLQIHLHPEFLSKSLFENAGVKHPVDMFHAEPDQARLLVDIAVERHLRLTGMLPLAFRGGGYRYGENILKELARSGVRFNSGYNPSRRNQPFNIGPHKQFKWSSGVIELPIACVSNFKKTARVFDYNFNADVLIKGSIDQCVQKHADFLQDFFRENGDDAVAVMVMHSWSFLMLDKNGHYASPNSEAVAKFEAVMAILTRDFSIITTKDLPLEKDSESVASLALHSYGKNSTEKNGAISSSSLRCEVCGATDAVFIDYKGSKRKCGECGSLERQRTLAALIKNGARGVDFGKKRILHISPSSSEKRILDAAEGSTITTLDIRPETRPDIVADLCYMPQIAADTFDLVLCSHVLSHVHAVDRALSEIYRVLKRDGILIVFEPVLNGRTRELSDLSEITSNYGSVIFEKYKVGRYRFFGIDDFGTFFDSYFSRAEHNVLDGITGTEVVWNVCQKKDKKNGEEGVSMEQQRGARFGVSNEHVDISVKVSRRKAETYDRLKSGEWLFLKQHVVRAGEEVEIFGRLLEPGPRSIAIHGIDGKEVACIDITGCWAASAVAQFDAACSMETGAVESIGFITIPDSLESGVYFFDRDWLFFVQGEIERASVVVVLPLSTMHFFNNALGGSAYDEKYKGQQFLRCSVNRPLHRTLLTSKACVSESALRWLTQKLTDQIVSYVSECDVESLAGAQRLELMIIVGRSEDWTIQSRQCMEKLLQSGVNLLCLSAETMYHDIKVDRLANVVERDRSRYRWVEKEQKNPLRRIIGSNPYDGGFLANMSGHNDPGYGRYTLIDADDPIFRDVVLLRDNEIDLPSVAYDGLPVLHYDPAGKPILDISNVDGWARVDLLAFCCGVNSPAKRVGAFARFKGDHGKGDCIHAGSMSWVMNRIYEAEGQGKGNVLSILSNAIDELLGKKKHTVRLQDPIDYHEVATCPICANSLASLDKGQNCQDCGSRARTRSMAPLLHNVIGPALSVPATATHPLLAFSLSILERKLLEPVFPHIKSVSLFGNYGANNGLSHEIGVDMRQMSRYGVSSFSGVFCSLIFDYFLEHDDALNECARVLVDGGIFVTHIAPFRLVDGDAAPIRKGAIKSKKGYFEYLPDEADLADVCVGREWFLSAMRRAGLEGQIHRVRDRCGLISDWFVGIKKKVDLGAKIGMLGYSDHGALHVSGGELQATPQELHRLRGASGWFQKREIVIEALTLPITEPVRFLQDHFGSATSQTMPYERCLLVVGKKSNDVLASYDGGNSWTVILKGDELPGAVYRSFGLRNGACCLATRTSKSVRVNVFDNGLGRGSYQSHSVGEWFWLGAQGIGQSENGVVMFADYAPLQIQDGVVPLSVYRNRDVAREGVWEKILTLDAAAWPKIEDAASEHGDIRHFHICHPIGRSNWLLASGDIRRQNRVWLSSDDGDSWVQLLLSFSLRGLVPEHSKTRLVRFTQFVLTQGGDVLWATDDTLGIGRAALVRMTLTGGTSAHLEVIGLLGENCVRNILAIDSQNYLIVSESKENTAHAEIFFYDNAAQSLERFDLPNVTGQKSAVTESLGSVAFFKQQAFLPMMGAILSKAQCGVLRLTVRDI